MHALTRRELLSCAGAMASVVSCGCAAVGGESAQTAVASDEVTEPSTVVVRILATSDTHGKFVPWNYPMDEADASGSLAQLASAIDSLRDDNTILVDAGDTIQDNMAEFFLAHPVHPMLACMATMGYDVGVCGNHEFDQGMDVVRGYIEDFPGTSLLGNVYDADMNLLADAYTIVERAGVRVALIGMVTPNIAQWSASQLEGYRVTNPVEETRAIIDAIRDDVDVLVAVCHMGLEPGYGVAGSGALELAEACPELDLIVSAHTHTLIEGDDSSGVLIVQNREQGKTLTCTDLTLEREGGRWRVVASESFGLEMRDFEPKAEVEEVGESFDEEVKAYAREVVGTLVGGPLVPKGNSPSNPLVVTQDTPLVDLINRAQLHYSGADVSMTPVFRLDADVEPGEIRRSDVSRIYKMTNDLYVMAMTGSQLRRYLEYTASIFDTWEPGELTLAADPDVSFYKYDMFEGITYAIDVSREPGSRIASLAWPDGRAVADDDVLRVAVNGFRFDSDVAVAGHIFEEGDMPELVEAGVHAELGSIREMICDYIENVCGGTIHPDCDDSWRLVGADWDPALHDEAIRLADEGAIATFVDGHDWGLPNHAVTTDELEAHTAAMAS